MNHPAFTQLRRQIDDAITFHDGEFAQKFARDGLRLAQEKECPGEAFYFQAQFAIIDERYDDAVPFLEKALQFNPKDGAAYNDLALCRIESGKIDGVIELFDQGIAVEPDYATIRHNKGWFLNKTGRYAEAIVCFQKALEIEPDRAVTCENLADAYESLGRIGEALAASRRALALVKNSCGSIRRQIEDEVARLELELKGQANA